ncbi:fimbrial protein [Pseudomonas sp. NPDC096917]|uniref:fimbrial protein n=1 Tax=Pseudomonas sp. NPDC096917 TaxID=3364483 RepID=UPI00383A3AB3
MKRLIIGLISLGLISYWQTGLANTCFWEPGRPPGPQLYRQDMGSVYIPRDAGIGSIIGEFKKYGTASDENNAQLRCTNDGSVTLDFSINAVRAISPVLLPPVNGEDVNGKVIETNISGVGAYIQLGFPFSGGATNAFTPMGPPVIPFTAIHNQRMSVVFNLTRLITRVTLIKTGDITPGPQPLDGGTLATSSLTGVGKGFDFGISGTVIQAQCSVSATAVSADPVDLKEWDIADFKGPDTGTTPVPFSITLENCIADPENNNIATAHIRLDGAKDSVPIDSAKGLFSLSADSDARGVGIQVLTRDGITPFELEKEIPVVAISPGNVVLDFKARLYQTEPTSEVKPGIAKGALAFTITYK